MDLVQARKSGGSMHMLRAIKAKGATHPPLELITSRGTRQDAEGRAMPLAMGETRGETLERQTANNLTKMIISTGKDLASHSSPVTLVGRLQNPAKWAWLEGDGKGREFLAPGPELPPSLKADRICRPGGKVGVNDATAGDP